MKILRLHFIIMANLLLFTSCGKEKLTPQVSSKTVNELRDDQPVNFSYTVDATQIDEYARGAGKFPIFGKLFQGIAFVLANSTINSNGGQALDVKPIDVELDTFNEVDFDFIEWIRLDSLVAHVDKAKKKDSLDFIEKIEIYALIDSAPGGMVRLVYFDRQIHPLDCDGKCLKLRIEKVDWKELIRNNLKVKLQPKIVINSVPKSSMALAGSVSFSIKFNLGF